MAAGIAALGALLSGQQRGQEQSDYLKAQLQHQTLDDDLKRQTLMEHLQQMQRYEAARGGLPKDQQGKLDLGYTPEELQKTTDRATKANAMADQLYQKAMDTSLPADQRMQAAMMSANLRAHPEVYDTLPNWMKVSGIGEKSGRPFEFVDKTSGAPVMYSGTGPIPPNAVPLGVYQTMHRAPKETGSDKWMDKSVNDTGGNIVTPSGEPWPNPAATRREAIAAGGIVLSDKAKDTLGQSDAAESGLNDLLAAGKKVLPAAAYTGGAYINPLILGGRHAAGDPDVGAYRAASIALIPHLRAVAQVARVNQTELDAVNGALANANSYPELVAAVGMAQAMLRRARPNLVKAGRLQVPSESAAPSSSGSRVRLPSGMYYDPKDGKAYTNP